MKDKIIVAIDGYSSCGKSSMARTLAEAIGYIYVDTGAMYRGVTLWAIRKGFIENGLIDASSLERSLGDLELAFRLAEQSPRPELYLNGEHVEQAIRSMEVASQVSPVAALGFVRSFLTAQQQEMGRHKGIVMDGRDIGTAVFPDAELKVFVTADPQVRAERRLAELRSKGDHIITMEEVLANLQERDYIDTHREVAPLIQAPDALVLDNSHLTIPEQDALLHSYYQAALARRG